MLIKAFQVHFKNHSYLSAVGQVLGEVDEVMLLYVIHEHLE